MIIEQIYTGCISQAAYFLMSDGEAAIFDPLREVDPYIRKAEGQNARIKYVFETHFHADFVSGHMDLAAKSGADIVYGPTAAPEFSAIIAEDGQEFSVGKCKVKAIHTPGHTMESTCYLIFDEVQQMCGIITGDTLFIGDVGRPDLAQKSSTGLTPEILAGHLYDSLRNKIMPLPDHLTVYPSHGAGSACGKNMSKETTDLLGNQKLTNYALRADMTREEFVSEVLDGLGAPPAYFPQNVMLNIKGYESLDSIFEKSRKALAPGEFKSMAFSSEVVMLDVRHETDFVKEHIPGSVFIGIQGNFAQWVGALLMNVYQPILLIADSDKIDEAITRLSRVGFDNVVGYLQGGISAWKDAGFEIDSIRSVSPEIFAADINNGKPVVDSRRPAEYDTVHLENAINLPLDNFNQNFREVPREEFYIHCAGGYRSVIMSSLLKARGYHNMINVEKGMSGIRTTQVPLIENTCQN